MEEADKSCIHHVEIGVWDGRKFLEKFTSEYPFEQCAKREGHGVIQWLLRPSKGNNRTALNLLLSQITCVKCVTNDPFAWVWFDISGCTNYRLCNECAQFKDNAVVSNSFDSVNSQVADSVFNIAFEVKDVHTLTQKFTKNNGTVIKDVQTYKDDFGYINISQIKSVIGNVVHSMINSQNYNGVFLPGFVPCDIEQSIVCHSQGPFTHIDHFTLACDVGHSSSIIQWYEQMFDMKRFTINRQEDEKEGFVISGEDIGLRMKAMEFWKCAEQGLLSRPNSSLANVRIVLVEALLNQGPNQVETFLCEHGGPGIQHIGLHSPNICATIRDLKFRGVQFAEPPFTYYSEIGRLKDIISVGLDSTELKDLGILIDTEEDEESEESNSSENPGNGATQRYLLQKFTKPLFDQDTFFLEVIQRLGATGFGSGNITALWRSVQAYMNQR